MIDRFLEEATCSSVVVDHVQGGYAATKYLLDHGHKKIGCITGPRELEDSCDRFAGYKKALDEYEVAFRKELVYEGKYDCESGQRERIIF